MRRNGARDREILINYEAGASMPELAKKYNLEIGSISAILVAERLRREVCPEPAYSALRQKRYGIAAKKPLQSDDPARAPIGTENDARSKQDKVGRP
jgi:hypothetical protein